MSPLRWTCKSLRRLAAELNNLGHKISHTVVGELLKAQKFSLQANRKTKEGADNPDRDAQFRFINTAVETALAENQPVISVDTKKKELVGDFKNAGREWRPQGDPEEVRVHDFLIKELGRVVPYGIYDLAANTGWVNVGTDNDTAAFAVQTIRRWWQDISRVRYPLAKRLVITVDGGGSNGSRVRLWRRVESWTYVEAKVSASWGSISAACAVCEVYGVLTTRLNSKSEPLLLRTLKAVFRRHQSQPVDRIVRLINPVLRGWVNYFAVGHASKCFGLVKDWVEQKIRRQMMRARNRQGFGWTRWSRSWLYETLKLFNGYRVVRPASKVASAR